VPVVTLKAWAKLEPLKVLLKITSEFVVVRVTSPVELSVTGPLKLTSSPALKPVADAVIVVVPLKVVAVSPVAAVSKVTFPLKVPLPERLMPEAVFKVESNVVAPVPVTERAAPVPAPKAVPPTAPVKVTEPVPLLTVRFRPPPRVVEKVTAPPVLAEEEEVIERASERLVAP
jgi:hypothetical protein